MHLRDLLKVASHCLQALCEQPVLRPLLFLHYGCSCLVRGDRALGVRGSMAVLRRLRTEGDVLNDESTAWRVCLQSSRSIALICQNDAQFRLGAPILNIRSLPGASQLHRPLRWLWH